MLKKMTISLLLIVIVHAGPAWAKAAHTWETQGISERDSHMLEHKITGITKRTQSPVSLAALDLNTGKSFALNGDERLPMASTYKVAVAIRILQAIEEDKLSLETQANILPYKYVPWGIISEYFFRPGVSLSVYNLMEVMIRQSDNTATDVLTDMAGGTEAINQIFTTHTIENISINRSEADLLSTAFGIDSTLKKVPLEERTLSRFRNLLDTVDEETEATARAAFIEDPRDTASANAFVKLLTLLVQGNLLTAEHTDILIDIMKRTLSGPYRIKGQLPKNMKVAHKTGTLRGSVNDVGLIYVPGLKHPIVLAVLIKNSQLSDARTEPVIAEVAKLTVDYFRMQDENGD